MDTTKCAKKDTKAVSVALQSVHREILSLFNIETIGDDRQYWRDFAFGAATQQHDVALFRECYLRSEVLKRFQKGSITAKDRRDSALLGLEADEDWNRACTPRIVDFANRPGTPDDVRESLLKARTIVKDILGPFSWEKLYLLSEYSSGASTEHLRSDAHIQLKWESSTHITARALPHYLGWLAYIGEPRLNGTRSFQLVKGNEVFTCPKNYEKDRVIAKEPPLNMFLQKGYGTIVRLALNRRGLLLPDAQETHKALAERGSATGSLATLDMKSASNSNTAALVEELLPAGHLEPVMDLRSPIGTLPDGREIVWEMVSSMGNGYTFELETLLFYSVCRAVCGKDAIVSVYGDDIVVPSDRAAQCQRVLEFCGYRSNDEKSFASGPFRESCGGHYFDGQDVSPFYIEDLPNSPAECVDLHNRMLQWFSIGGDPTPFWGIINALRRAVPRAYRGPFGESGCLWSDWDQATPVFHRCRDEKRPQYNCWTVKSYVKRVPKQVHDYLEGCLLSGLWIGVSRSDKLRNRATHLRDLVRTASLKPTALFLYGSQMRDANQAEITFAKYGRWATAKRYLRVGRQWAPVPVRGWEEHSVR